MGCTMTGERVINGMGDTWVIVCNHLVKRPVELDWREVRSGDVITGYLCEDCYGKGARRLRADGLQPMSTVSIRALRRSRS